MATSLSQTNTYTLTVVDIIPMCGGLSYLCCNIEGKMYRLVPGSDNFVWPKTNGLQVQVGLTYSFTLSVNQVSQLLQRIVVLPPPPSPISPLWMYSLDLLAMQAKSTLEGVFQTQVIDRKYVTENAYCQSLGTWVLPKAGSELNIYTSTKYEEDETQTRILIGGYDLPYISEVGVAQGTSLNWYVIVTLASPFSGKRNFCPRRRYIMVLGVKG